MNVIKYYPLSLLTTIVVTALSLLPIGRVEIAENVPLADKWTHMVMYAGLTAVVCRESLKKDRAASLLLPLLYAITLGGVMELMQAFCTTYRSGEWMDFVADSIGALIGVLIGDLLLLVVRWRKK